MDALPFRKSLFLILVFRALRPMSLCRALGTQLDAVAAARWIWLLVFRCFRHTAVFPCMYQSMSVVAGSAFQTLCCTLRNLFVLAAIFLIKKPDSFVRVPLPCSQRTNYHNCTVWNNTYCLFGKVEKAARKQHKRLVRVSVLLLSRLIFVVRRTTFVKGFL